MTTGLVPYKEVIMVHPQYFDIKYAINSHMLDANGNLNQINKQLALTQWNDLKNKFLNLNLKVHVLEASEEFPDMVFSANQSFIFKDAKTEEKKAVISNMRSNYRKKETSFFKDWYKNNHYKIFELGDESSELCFEGNGDIIPHPDFSFFWGGAGPRTDRAIYDQLNKKLNLKFEVLNLTHPDFYHLDTCFVVLDTKTCAFVPAAFSQSDAEKIKNHFHTTITITEEEAKKYFAANAFCPDGKNVVVQIGTKKFKADLKNHGFNIIEVDTSEFMKSGGSVFCMKMALI